MVNTLIQQSLIGTAYSLSVDFLMDNINKRTSPLIQLRSVVEGVALAIIHQKWGMGATYGAAIGLVIGRIGTQNYSRFAPFNENISNEAAKALFIGVGALLGKLLTK